MGERENYLRVPLTMPVEMVAFLEDLSLKAKTSGGKKLANTEIVRAWIYFAMQADVDVSGCKNEDDLLAAIQRTVSAMR